MIKTDGVWSRDEKGLYFMALFPTELKIEDLPFQKKICALAEKHLLKSQDIVNRFAGAYRYLLMDSGVFSIANQHAQKNGLAFEQGLMLRLDDLPKGEQYYEEYIETCQQVKAANGWGFIEIDLGGKQEKKRVRAKLHERGLSPIPVYHPLLDGPEYLDELISEYDRICVSNLVQSTSQTRTKLLSFVYEKIMALPEPQRPYVHYLGVGASPQFLHFRLGSCDASSWAFGRRVGDESVLVMGEKHDFGNTFVSKRGTGAQYKKQIYFELFNHGITPYETFFEENQ